MTAFLARRAVWFLLTLWIVYTISFFLMRSVPGGPFDAERKVEKEVRRNIEARYRLDRPLVEQYLTHLGYAVRFDFGPSYKLADFTVNEIIAQGFPVSASLGILALVFAISLGLTAGMISAVFRQTWIDVGCMAVATVGIAVPNFLLAGVSVILFVFLWQVFPAAGWGTLQQVVLPAFCLGAPFAAYIARLTRTGMLEVLGQDYIRTAHAKGLSPPTIVLRHALRGAVLPVVSYLGPATAGILTGSLVLEKIFALPGMGSHFIESATQRDYTLAMGMILVYTALLYVANTVVDLAYRFIDPRIQLE